MTLVSLKDHELVTNKISLETGASPPGDSSVQRELEELIVSEIVKHHNLYRTH